MMMMIYIMIVLLVLIDQLSKNYATKNFSKRKERSWGTLAYVENKGAVLGFLKHYPKTLKALNLLVMALVFHLIIQAECREEVWIYPFGLAFVIAGGSGNLIDRFRRGFVVDFFSPKVFFIKKMPYFNMADLYIFIGVICMLIASFKYEVMI